MLNGLTMNDLAEPAKAPDAGARKECGLDMPLGLLGFENHKKFTLISNPDEEPFQWLQAADEPSLTFLIVPTFDVLSEYAPDISEDDVAFLGLKSAEDAVVYGIVTLHRKGPATINLKGPIVVNRHSLKAKQVVITNATRYSVHHPIVTND